MRKHDNKEVLHFPLKPGGRKKQNDASTYYSLS
jgi:hypothetical protein